MMWFFNEKIIFTASVFLLVTTISINVTEQAGELAKLQMEVLQKVKLPDSDNVKFSAVTDNHYLFLHKLYLEEWNSDPPSPLDPVMTNPSIRSRICEDISKSGVFARYEKEPVDMTRIYDTLDAHQRLDTSDHFQCVLNSSAWQEVRNTMFSGENNDPYVSREVEIYEFFPSHLDILPVPKTRREYVFVCLLKHDNSDDMMPFYVSKAYNAADELRAHRFVFPKFPENERYRFFYEYEKLMLAEGSADVYTRSDFDLENYYLQHHRPGTAPEFDPVCKLNLKKLEDNQHLRLCNIVLTSPHFKSGIEYPGRLHHENWFDKKISFKNAKIKNLHEATGNVFHERMLRCYASTIDEGDLKVFYISRAYNPNQVFVYSEGPSSEEVYLEALCINVGIVD